MATIDGSNPYVTFRVAKTGDSQYAVQRTLNSFQNITWELTEDELRELRAAIDVELGEPSYRKS